MVIGPAEPTSPTRFELGSRAFAEVRLGRPLGPRTPSGKLAMDRGQAAASEMFRANLNALDPAGTLRNRGGFIQAFQCRDELMHALGPMQYGPVMALRPVPGVDGAHYVIHTRPPTAAGARDFPTNLDFLMACNRSRGNSNSVLCHLFYDHRAGHFYAYQGQLHPETGKPEFKQLENPYDMGPTLPGRQNLRSLPDPETWGQHLINWPSP